MKKLGNESTYMYSERDQMSCFKYIHTYFLLTYFLLENNNLGYLKVLKLKIPWEISNIESQYACSWFHPSLWPLRLLDVSVFYLSVKADSDFKVVVDALHSVLRPDATPKKFMAT